MGNYCKGQDFSTQKDSFNPIKINFKRIHPIAFPKEYADNLDKIKSVISFIDARDNIGLKWYSASPFDIYMLGDVNNGKPIGQCLFYIKPTHIEEDRLPVIICTRVLEDEKLSDETLLLYADKSYYFGQIISQGIQKPARANGKGILVTKQFIYEGQFLNGSPNGYGCFKTKSSQLTGEFKDGQPNGKCVQRSKKGLFIGQLIASYSKNGKLITPNNQVNFVNQQTQADPKNGHTIVNI